MVDFINEVEEELRKDEYNRLLRRYGPYLMGIIIIIIGATGYLEWRKAADSKASRAASAAFTQANEAAASGDITSAMEQFETIASKAQDGYSGLSYMRLAALSLESGARVEAVRMYDQAAQAFSKTRHKHLAQLKAAYIQASDGRYQDVQARLGALVSKDEPYEFLARELLAFTALQTDDLSKARQEYSYLATIPGVPPSIQTRAQQSLNLIKVDAANAKEAAAVPEDQTPVDNGGDDGTPETSEISVSDTAGSDAEGIEGENDE